jgi:hypothetical protein
MCAEGTGYVHRRDWLCVQKGLFMCTEGTGYVHRRDWLCVQKGLVMCAEAVSCSICFVSFFAK